MAGGRRALGHDAAQVEADAALAEPRGVFGVFFGVHAAVADDQHALVVVEGIGRRHAAGGAFHLAPIEAVRVRRLWDDGVPVFGGQRFAGSVVGGGDTAVSVDEASAVVFVVADDHMPRRRNFAPDHHGRTGASRGGQRDQKRQSQNDKIHEKHPFPKK